VVDTREALAVLGLGPGAAMTDVRAAYRRLVRQHHPDVAGPGETAEAARLTEAYASLRRAAHDEQSDTITMNGRAAAPAPPPRPAPPSPTPPTPTPYEEAIEAELAAGDTLLVRAPATETFAALFEAAGRIGHVAYFDRQLGILETIVRFEGGPSCSFLITLQVRADGTEAFCTLESIEADPTPPIQPVMDALIEALAA
jgi:molecular chaperone DnaJ